MPTKKQHTHTLSNTKVKYKYNPYTPRSIGKMRKTDNTKDWQRCKTTGTLTLLVECDMETTLENTQYL